MNTTNTALGQRTGLQSRTMPLLMAALLGLVIIGVSGFAQMDVLHNAAHDYRHSMAFPCH